MDSLIELLAAVVHALLWPVVLGLFLLLGWIVASLGAFAREAAGRRRVGERLAALASRLLGSGEVANGLDQVELRLAHRVARDAFLARLAPMLGLAGTLIPLGPGLAQLRAGDLAGFAHQLAVAFSTTVAGIVVCAASYWMSGVRGRWYEADLRSLERALEQPHVKA